MRKVIIGVAMVIGVVACAGGDDESQGSVQSAPAFVVTTEVPAADTYPATGEVEAVLSLDNNFVPQTVTVVAGTEVRWDNNGRNGHNVLPESDPQTTTWGVQVEQFQPGDSYSHLFDTPGTFVYYCSIHGTSTAGMFGTIIVTAP